jgi:preprotein translocase subunit SecD
VSRDLQLRAGAVLAVIVLFTWVALANFVPKEQRLESALWPDAGVRLGLDLQGGIHWVVGVQLDQAITHELEYVRSNIRDGLTEDGIVLSEASVQDQQLRMAVAQTGDLQKLKQAADDSGVIEVLSEEGSTMVYGLTSTWTQEIRERTMSQVLEVLRRRINDPVTGIPESIVARQGSDRVLVQIPGGQIDRGRAGDLLKSTGFLEFKIVQDRADNQELLLAKYPNGIDAEVQQIVTERDSESNVVIAAYLVPRSANITGDYLDDARVGRDPQQRPLVNFRFNPEGGKIFGELTEENVGNLLAIILDENVYSAPAIRSRITTRGQITGRFTPQEAADLAVVLRAGALSVPVVIEEERTVGPALGQDSIDAGTRASAVGLLLVLFFTTIYYRMAGGYAAFALMANLSMLIGIMSIFEATLTLPGIAGLVLTVGMAVDANVIIFERIREELRAGKTPRAAINTGYSKATWTVLDANITTLITAIILFQFGTGPIKGFAVTLSIGILTSVFAALVVTRVLFQLYPGGRTVQQLSI